tara:strand:- start:44 stop:604 length:561 start_codon:yes stop_codon:yes gene_type:complete
MALKFSFNKLRTAIAGFIGEMDSSKGALSAAEQAIYTPQMYVARPCDAITNAAVLTRQLLTAESGTLYTVDMSTADNNVTITLPAAADSCGCFFDFCFIVDSDDDADFILSTGLNATDIYGGMITLAAISTVDAFNAESKITVDGSVAQSAEGMNMHLLCDGVNWHLKGHLATAVGTVHLVESATI